MTAPPASGEISVRQRRITAWQAWLAIAGLVGHLLAMVAMSGGAHAASWVVDPATGARLEVSLCTDQGIAPQPELPGAAHAGQAHDCVLCSVHGATPVSPPALAPFDAVPTGAWAALPVGVPDGRPAAAAWPRGPPTLG